MSEESRKTGKDLRSAEITDAIIAAAIAVRRELGPGFLESVYEQALVVEFALRGIAFVRQKPIPLFYRDHQIGEHRLDFLVEDKIVVELKAIDGLKNVHFAIVRSYLKASGLADGLYSEFFEHAADSKKSPARARFSGCGSPTVRMNSCVPVFLGYA
jgi:GxxExxY protein